MLPWGWQTGMLPVGLSILIPGAHVGVDGNAVVDGIT